MPLWKRSSPEEIQRRQQEQHTAEASRQELERGGLPLKAQQRLRKEMATGHQLFTSNLSVNEFLLTRAAGYRPLSQVMGSSIYQVGWQFTRSYSWGTQMSEMSTLSEAHRHAALLALGRLEQEARLLHAHGVVGVRFTRRSYEWDSNLLEYTAIGTAITLLDVPLPPHPFLSDLSGQEFWTLLRAGYYPSGIISGYCSYYVSLGSQLTQQIQGWWTGGGTNQEIGPFTQGLYTARHLAMERAESMARKQQAAGIVGMHIENDRQVNEYETDKPQRKFLDLYVHFAVLGTAIIVVKKDHLIPAPRATLAFTDLRPGRYGQNRELTFHE